MITKKGKAKNRLLSVMLSAVIGLSSAAAVAGVMPVLTTEAATVGASVAGNSSYLSTNAITKGQSVTIYGVSNASKPVQFAYYYKKASSETWSTIKGYSTTASVKLTPAAATNYDILVNAKDQTGKVVKTQLSLKVSPALVNQSKISKSAIQKGSSVTLSGAAKGGSGSYSFAYYRRKAGASSWVTISQYSSSKTASFKPASAADYELLIKVRDSHGAIEKKTFALKVVPKLVNQSVVSANSIEVGDSVALRGAAEGGSGKYTYSYSYKPNVSQTWTVLKSYSTTTVMNCGMNIAGKFNFLIKVKDEAGNVSSKTFDVTVSDSSLERKADLVVGQIITKDMTEYDKAKAIHDWLVKNVEYDRSSPINEASYTADGVFDNHVAVCDGYAKAFLVLAERSGLEALRVTGTAVNGSGSTENHAWNQVKIDGKWYNVDVTWDDPIVSADYGDNMRYVYFLIPDSELNKDHTPLSAKNACTAPQPTDKLLPVLLEEERRSIPTMTQCANDTEIQQAVASFNVKFNNTFVLICKTNSSNASLQKIITDNMPGGSYSYSYNIKDWKLSGYKKLTIKIRVA